MSNSNDFYLPWSLSPQTPLPLTVRPQTLVGATVVLVDNGRLGHPCYADLFTALRALLIQTGARVLDLKLPLINFPVERLSAAAQEVAELQPAAVVVALGESGVSQPTTEFLICLEKLGIPAAGLFIGAGMAMARAVAANVMPGLQVIDLGVKAHEAKRAGQDTVTHIAALLIAAIAGPRQGDASPNHASIIPLIPSADAVLRDWNKAAQHDDLGQAAFEFLRHCEVHRLGDGLPVIPPTRILVDNMCAAVELTAETVLIDPSPPSGAAVTVGLAAVNAVMAGCEPRHFPCVVAVLRALAAPQYRLGQAAVTTHPGTNVILISGPMAHQAGLSSGAGCLGPGHRANLTIGRAVNLCIMNVLRSLPGISDLGTLGSAAEISTCFADQSVGTWPAWHEQRFDRETSAVLVHRCAPLCNVIDQASTSAEGILDRVAAASATIAWNNAYNPTELLVVLCPDHAETIQQQGWSRAHVQQYLFEHARNQRSLLTGSGLAPGWPASFDTLDRVPIVNSAADIIIVVAGGEGPQSQVGLPWGRSKPSLLAIGKDGAMRAAKIKHAAQND